jgi:hypothetical protein
MPIDGRSTNRRGESLPTGAIQIQSARPHDIDVPCSTRRKRVPVATIAADLRRESLHQCVRLEPERLHIAARRSRDGIGRTPRLPSRVAAPTSRRAITLW